MAIASVGVKAGEKEGCEAMGSSQHLLSVLVGVDDGRLAIEEIDHLQRQPLGLGYEKVGEDEAAQAGRPPDKEAVASEAAREVSEEQRQVGQGRKQVRQLNVHLDPEVGRLDSRGSGGGLVHEVRGRVRTRSPRSFRSTKLE